MNFFINSINDNGSGMKYYDKESFLKELSAMIDDCVANGGTLFDVSVEADASCFLPECDEENADLVLEYSELLECDLNIGRIKVDKSIFDCFEENTYVNICFSDDKTGCGVVSYLMISEDYEGIVMECMTD